ncbi:hypothetical protein SAMN05421541_1331 [Actinoplanes philippinensis]|uniref:Uncharacterized protein n=1 Tax=Actinoplanes philippinensis TaxID=35752 RepID=A0A1I2MR86_9ACTN|nr:hypothetical protein SAMN05421541_1331 [Actinoplanes philippinensis]
MPARRQVGKHTNQVQPAGGSPQMRPVDDTEPPARLPDHVVAPQITMVQRDTRREHGRPARLQLGEPSHRRGDRWRPCHPERRPIPEQGNEIVGVRPNALDRARFEPLPHPVDDPQELVDVGSTPRLDRHSVDNVIGGNPPTAASGSTHEARSEIPDCVGQHGSGLDSFPESVPDGCSLDEQPDSRPPHDDGGDRRREPGRRSLFHQDGLAEQPGHAVLNQVRRFTEQRPTINTHRRHCRRVDAVPMLRAGGPRRHRTPADSRCRHNAEQLNRRKRDARGKAEQFPTPRRTEPRHGKRASTMGEELTAAQHDHTHGKGTAGIATRPPPRRGDRRHRNQPPPRQRNRQRRNATATTAKEPPHRNASPPCHADVRQPVYQGILFLDGPEESTSA